MRILIVNFEYPPLGGGGGVFNALLAQELAKRHEVTVLTSQGLGLPAESTEKGVKVVRVPVYLRKQAAAANLLSMLMFLPMGIAAGRRLCKTNQYDVINTHFVLPTGPVGDALAKSTGIPHVLTIQGGDIYDPSKWTSPHRHALLRQWVSRLLRRAHVVVWSSSNLLLNMHRFYGPEIQGVRIPLGIRRPEPGVGERRRYGIGKDEILLVTVGRLVARKAVNQLIHMMSAMKDERVRLLIIGSGPQEMALKRQAHESGLDHRVIFLGQVAESEKFQILRMCDVYVSTSQHEGFGLVFLEAMACGLPVVCYNFGGQTDFLEDGTTGYLVGLNDQDCFRDRCLLLIKDADLRGKIGRDNSNRAEEYYIENCALKYEHIFNEARGGQEIHGTPSVCLVASGRDA